MDVQSQLLFIGSSADIKIMVAERKRVRGLGKTPAHPKVSHSRPTATGGDEEFTHKSIPQKGINLMCSYKRSATTDWQCRPAGKG